MEVNNGPQKHFKELFLTELPRLTGIFVNQSVPSVNLIQG